jgi:hypothetical protein
MVMRLPYPEKKTEWDKYFPSEVKFTHDLKAIEAVLRPFGTTEVKREFNLFVQSSYALCLIDLL